ncbi:hypothetical protein NIES4075_09110 [Tolypothrix sp. NIES-4075]|uniref:hypothetical protein n=1 Tax=Tolypothrix sp. NIES-4075 TaxID=2005459 RepID=UPI000B5D040D|nr:hypothetical protein [Tolypothrix sp. NIES-4075]GAX39949.1 hypothetical protein NIES4075_09110 [Tolypothrix sp. NIES-4075]
MLINLIKKCTADEQQGISLIWHQILKFDMRMQEFFDTGSIVYGKGKSKPCAELRFDKDRNGTASWQELRKEAYG